MANKEIGGLLDAGTLTGAELLHIVQSGNSRKITIKKVLASIALAQRSNLSVNGSLAESQINGNTLGTVSGYRYADQHFLFQSGGLGISVQRVAYTSLAGSAAAAEFKCTTVKAALGAADLVTDFEPIEGARDDFIAAAWGTSNAKPFVYRKEVQKPAGTYHFHGTNSAQTRHCAIPYVITPDKANVPTVVEVVFPADTSGAWLTGKGQIGIVIDDVLVAGSTYTGGSASTWGNTAYYAATTQKNFLDNINNVARHTDFGFKFDPDATGVYGAYKVGEVDPVFNVERYIEIGQASGPTNNDNVFSAPAAATQRTQFRVKKCKIPAMSASDGAGNAGRYSGNAGGTGTFGQVVTAGSLAGGATTTSFLSDFTSSAPVNRWFIIYLADSSLSS